MTLINLIDPPRGISIDIREKRMYIPSAFKQGGFQILTEPIYECELDIKNCVAIMKERLKNKEVVKEVPKDKEIYKKQIEKDRKNYKKILKKMGLTSERARWKSTGMYGIEWFDDKVKIHLHALDKKGRPVSDPERILTFPIDTPLEKLVEIILEDVKQFPHIKT